MARVTGPLMSLTASGTIGKAVTYSHWKGRPYARERVIPMNPRAAKQTGVRSMMSFLAQAWYALSAPNKASWNERASSVSISSFNAYVSENLMRWQSFLTPTQAYPAVQSSTGLTVTTQTLTGGVGTATIAVTPSAATGIWGILIFRDTAEITTPSWANCIAVLFTSSANAKTYVDSPLAAGTYHYRTAVFNVDGVIGTVKVDGSAVVTAP